MEDSQITDEFCLAENIPERYQPVLCQSFQCNSTSLFSHCLNIPLPQSTPLNQLYSSAGSLINGLNNITDTYSQCFCVKVMFSTFKKLYCENSK